MVTIKPHRWAFATTGFPAALSILSTGLLLRASLCVQAQQATPPAPRSFEAIAVSTGEIHCYWLPASGATGYRLTRDGQTIASLPPTAQDYADKSLSSNTVHHYAIMALQGELASTPREDVDCTFTPFGEDRRQKTAGKPSSFILHPSSFDVVIVQASSGGVAAAVEAARRGLKVALVEPTTRLGGMPVNGLSSTDIRRDYHASGFLVRFADRVKQLYSQEGVKTDGLRYEPRIAHNAMKSLVFEQPNITVFRHARLSRVKTERSAITSNRRRVTAVEIEEIDGQNKPTGGRMELAAPMFIDATDCGDLAALAGAKFRVGREARSKREPHNGVIYYDRARDSPLPGSTGAGDRRIQSYAYLFVVKDYGPNVDKTIPKPPGYRREDFIHSPAWKDSWAFTSGKLPQGKYELNQHPQGGDLQEINYAYPTADYATRDRIEREYRDHVLGYLYYIQTEQGQKQLGAPDDEYRDTNGFPPLLYVREGRRIIGEQLPDESDVTNARSFVRPESVGIGDYPMDSHAVRVKTDWDRPDMGEGEWWLYKETPWHQLPLGILIPKGLDNVWVTTAVSSTHVSFGTYRLEPVRMEFGQAAAIGAYLGIRYHKIARDVPARQIQDEMLPHAANLNPDPSLMLSYLSDVKPTTRHYRAIQYLVSRGFTFGEETFKPDAPTTGKELAQMLQKLTERAAPSEQPLGSVELGNGMTLQTVVRGYYPYMGAAADFNAARECLQTLNTDTPITRHDAANWLMRVLNWQTPRIAGATHYADVDANTSTAAETLYDHNITSELWDGLGHRTPEDRLLFKPDAPLSHADLFAALYLAQIGLGPLFNDNPVDGRNGFPVPPAVYQTVTKEAVRGS